jgi:hypothetical protein
LIRSVLHSIRRGIPANVVKQTTQAVVAAEFLRFQSHPDDETIAADVIGKVDNWLFESCWCSSIVPQCVEVGRTMKDPTMMAHALTALASSVQNEQQQAQRANNQHQMTLPSSKCAQMLH